MRRTAAVIASAALLVTVAACGDDDDPVSTGGPAPSGDAELIRIEVGGGFVPFGADFAAVPTVVLGDGTAFTGGPMTMQFPGPARNPVLTGTVPAEVVQDLLAQAAEADLDEEDRDFGRPGVTDLPSTTITVVIDGVATTTSIYALDVAATEADPGVSADQREAREQVAAFVAAVSDAVTAAADEAYEPVAYQVLALPSEPAAALDEQPAPGEFDWPVPSVPLAEGDCRDVAGTDAAVLATALEQAASNTVWRDGGTHWRLVVRAALPSDEPCPTPTELPEPVDG